MKRKVRMALLWSLATALLVVGILLAIPADTTPPPGHLYPLQYWRQASYTNQFNLAVGVALMAVAGIWMCCLVRTARK